MAVHEKKYKPSEIMIGDSITIDKEDVTTIYLTDEFLSLTIKRDKAEKYIDIEKLKEDFYEMLKDDK